MKPGQEGSGAAAETSEPQLGVLEASPNAIVAIDAGGRITYANPQVEATYGCSRTELLETYPSIGLVLISGFLAEMLDLTFVIGQGHASCRSPSRRASSWRSSTMRWPHRPPGGLTAACSIGEGAVTVAARLRTS